MKHGTTKTLKVSCLFLIFFFLFSAIALLPQPVKAGVQAITITQGYPDGVAVSPDGKYVYVAVGGGSFSSFNYLGWVSVINASTNTVATNIVDPNEPNKVVVSPNNQSVYVLNGDPAGVAVIDTNSSSPTFDQVTTTITLPYNYPADIAISSNGEYVYVSGGDVVTQISTSTNSIVESTTDLTNSNNDISGLAVTPNGEYVYVATSESDIGVAVISTSTMTLSTTILDPRPGFPGDYGTPYGVAITPSGIAYVDNYYGSVLVIDTATNEATSLNETATGMSDPTGMAISPDGNYVYFATNGPVTVMSTATNTVVATITPPGITYPDTIAITPNGEYFYIPDSNGDVVYAINTYIAPTVSVSPTSATLDVGHSQLFTANPSGGSGTFSSYQWYVNGTSQSDQNASTFSFAPASTGSYSITATVNDSSGATSAQSNAASVTVNSALVAPTVTPSPSTVTQGQYNNLTSTALITGTSPYTYQWFSEAPSASTYTLISDANTSNYSFVTTTSTTAGTWNFILQATDNTGTAVNSTATSVNVSTLAATATPTPSPSPTATSSPTATATPVSIIIHHIAY